MNLSIVRHMKLFQRIQENKQSVHIIVYMSNVQSSELKSVLFSSDELYPLKRKLNNLLANKFRADLIDSEDYSDFQFQFLSDKAEQTENTYILAKRYYQFIKSNPYSDLVTFSDENPDLLTIVLDIRMVGDIIMNRIYSHYSSSDMNYMNNQIMRYIYNPELMQYPQHYTKTKSKNLKVMNVDDDVYRYKDVVKLAENCVKRI